MALKNEFLKIFDDDNNNIITIKRKCGMQKKKSKYLN